jgi:hypothetical protein
LPPIELGPVNPGRSRNELAAPAQHGVANFKNSQIWPSLPADAQYLLEDAIGRHVGQSLNFARCFVSSSLAQRAVHQEMRAVVRRLQQSAPGGEKVRNVLLLRCDHVGVALLDDIVEAKLEPRVLAVSAKCVWYGPVRVDDGEDVADAALAVASQLLDAAHAGLEW